MKTLVLCLVPFASLALAENNIRTISMGDGNVDGLMIDAYEHSWSQCILQEGKWTDGGTVTERSAVIGPLLRHQQITERPDGIRAVATTYFRHDSLSPIRMELEVADADNNQLAASERELTRAGYSGYVIRPGADKQEVSGTLSSQMYHGAVLGLPLATLDYTKSGYELDSSMMNFDAHYRVIATSDGTEDLVHDGKTYSMTRVDVEWHHDNGDIYPPGPDGSGGRYWVLRENATDLPQVIRYKTDTYAVEFFPDTCATD